MPYQINYEDGARSELREVPGHIRPLIRDAIKALMNNPRPSKAKELRGKPGRYRQAIDRWRIVYDVDEEYKIITVVAVRRKTGIETYQNLVE